MKSSHSPPAPPLVLSSSSVGISYAQSTSRQIPRRLSTAISNHRDLDAAYKPTQLYFLNLWRFAQPPQLNFKFMITNLNTKNFGHSDALTIRGVCWHLSREYFLCSPVYYIKVGQNPFVSHAQSLRPDRTKFDFDLSYTIARASYSLFCNLPDSTQPPHKV